MSTVWVFILVRILSIIFRRFLPICSYETFHYYYTILIDIIVTFCVIFHLWIWHTNLFRKYLWLTKGHNEGHLMSKVNLKNIDLNCFYLFQEILTYQWIYLPLQRIALNFFNIKIDSELYYDWNTVSVRCKWSKTSMQYILHFFQVLRRFPECIQMDVTYELYMKIFMNVKPFKNATVSVIR